MLDEIDCRCRKCHNLPSRLRQVSRNLAQKHLKKYGLPPTTTQTTSHTTNTAASLSTATQPQTTRTAVREALENEVPLWDDGGPGDEGDVQMLGDTRARSIPPLPPPVPQPLQHPLHENPPAPIPSQRARPTPLDTTWTTVSLPEQPPHLPTEAPPIVAPAYTNGESPSVRVAYLQAVYNSIVKKQPVDDVSENLQMTLDAIEAERGHPISHPKPVRHLASAKRRLGLDPDMWIIEYAACPRCWKHHTLKQMDELATAACSVPGCDGVIYEEGTDGKGKTKRAAKLIIPQTSLIQSLRRMVRRKGFRKLIRDSRGVDGQRNEDPNFVMEDMHDAPLWYDLWTGIKREVGNLGTVRDVPVSTGSERRLTDHRFGLHLTINTDWCV